MKFLRVFLWISLSCRASLGASLPSAEKNATSDFPEDASSNFTLSDYAREFWKNVTSKFAYTWVADTTRPSVKETLPNDHVEVVPYSSRIQYGFPSSTYKKPIYHQQLPANKKKPQESKNKISAVSITSSRRSGAGEKVCEELDFTCLGMKLFKVLGAAFGGGLLVALILPPALYFTFAFIGIGFHGRLR